MAARFTLLAALCAALLAGQALPLRAQAVPPNTPPKPLLTSGDLLLLGSFAVGTALVAPLDRSLALRLQNPRNQENRWMRRTADVVRTVAAPGAYVIGTTLYLAGRLGGNERMADLGLHGTEALVIGGVVGGVLKGTFGRARPYVHADPNPSDYGLLRGFRTRSTDYQSFPSGHTIAAFAAAAAVTSETRRLSSRYTWVVGPLLYGGAALAGASRMYNNRHWGSDVVTGAAIGTFAGLKVVRYHHSHPNNQVDRVLLSVSVSPTSTGEWRRFGVSVVPLR